MIWEIVKQIISKNPENMCYKQIASHLCVCNSTVFRWSTDPKEHGVNLPSNQIIPLTNCTGSPLLLTHFANECGFFLVKIPDLKLRTVKAITQNLAKTMKEFSDFIAKSSNCISDGILTSKEIAEIKIESKHAIEQILYFDESLKAGDL